MNINGRLAGKVALITGASVGIGRACAKLMAAEGAAVVIADMRETKGHELVDLICHAGGTVGYWHLDVTSEYEVESVMKAVIAKFGTITVLVNAAGITGVNKPTHEITSDEWDKLVAVNEKGVFFCTKHAVKQMMKAGCGSIVNISLMNLPTGAADMAPYNATTGAVTLMTRSDAMLYAPQGIRVNSVSAGFIWTPMLEHSLTREGDLAERRKAIEARQPLGRMGEPEDVAYGALYLASDESRFVTGTELVIDGGYTAR